MPNMSLIDVMKLCSKFNANVRVLFKADKDMQQRRLSFRMLIH